jgi:hypothetical protein
MILVMHNFFNFLINPLKFIQILRKIQQNLTKTFATHSTLQDVVSWCKLYIPLSHCLISTVYLINFVN